MSECDSDQPIMEDGAGMQTVIAVLRRMLVRRDQGHVEKHLGVLVLTWRYMRLLELFRRDRRGERGRNDLAIEAEHRFMVCAARKSNLSRLGGF